jgi:hypothetical protein
MYGDMILLSGKSGPAVRAKKLRLGDTGGRNEAWIRDTLIGHPDILPIGDISPSYGPLISLCRELRTPAGSVDAVFINHHGLLTLVECKLWRNPESRRKVVGQVLDYASAISRWSYSDLQRQVAQATGRKGNVPFELVASHYPDLDEGRFVDAVSEGLRRGRFLLLVAGDGIREDVEAMAELLDRNFAGGFSFGLIQIALFDGPDDQLIIQPRVLAKTRLIERRNSECLIHNTTAEPPTSVLTDSSSSRADAPGSAESAQQSLYRRWWQPVVEMQFDDPDQEPPRLYWPNHVRTPLPWPRTWLTAYRSGTDIAVSTGGYAEAMIELQDYIVDQSDEILAELPQGATYRPPTPDMYVGFAIRRKMSDFPNDDEAREWVMEILNHFANSLRPRYEKALKMRDSGI